ncbi:hypothetical protein ACWGII_13800 [Streptomyces sp. NPDC054855]
MATGTTSPRPPDLWADAPLQEPSTDTITDDDLHQPYAHAEQAEAAIERAREVEGC